MEARKQQAGFTLIEILVVIAIIVLLTTGMVKVAQTVRTNTQIKVTKGTISLLVSALGEYKNFHDRGSGFEFPIEPDVYDFFTNDSPPNEGLIDALLRYVPVDTGNSQGGEHNVFAWKDMDLLTAEQEEGRRLALATIEFLYCVMEDVPGCKAILEKLPVDVAVNDDNDSIVIRGQAKTLLEVNDAWGHPLWYTVRGERSLTAEPPQPGNFPAIASAGPDGLFNTADDIVSTEF
ncbi:MAG: type II secretion system protein [Sedimentisphaerales bacterium]|nr:type II secretion system protein [Sedimentisphaerales bacterium]